MLCSVTAALAQEISADEALQRAVEKIGKKSYARKVRGKADFALVHTEKGVGNGKALFYVFGKEKTDGFLIAGADLRANAVLGYTENGTYEEALQIPAFRSWIEGCQEAMQWLSNNATEAKAAKKSQQYNIPDMVATSADNTMSLIIPGRQYVPDASLPSSVKPLLGELEWDQNEPYNRLCPEITVDEEKMKCATGCVATAVAQIMKYYEWPKQGTGSHSYTWKGGDEPVELEADFSKSVYDWDNMLDKYKEGEYNDVQANAVAKLMSDVGIALDMIYGPSSGAIDVLPAVAMTTYFGYNKGMQLCERYYYNYVEWNNLIKKELAELRPVCVGGRNAYEDEGHNFVLDGYDEDGYYHVNWGWGGKSNGYFDINLLDPDFQGTGGSKDNYPAALKIFTNCIPDMDGTSEAHSLIAVYNEPVLRKDTIYSLLINHGLVPYQGKIGLVACVDDKIISSYFVDVTEIDSFQYYNGYSIHVPMDSLGITPEMIGDNFCYIYPAYFDGTTYKVPKQKQAFQNYVLLGVVDGEFVSMDLTRENAHPECEKIEITRDYTGFDVKGKAVISNKKNSTTFDRVVTMCIYDENNNLMAYGSNFAFIDEGESAELTFCCKPLKGCVLVEGKTYFAELEYSRCGLISLIPGSETTVTLRNPGAEPQLSYSNFRLDKYVVAPNDKMTISFDVENTGGFGTEEYDFAFFRDGENTSFNVMSLTETDLPTGKTTVSATLKMDFGEGKYKVNIYKDRKKVFPELLYFTIKNPETAISSITSNTNASNIFYDLQGRRVASPAKGIYIKDGKKVVK